MHSRATFQAANHIENDEVAKTLGVNDCAGHCVYIHEQVLPRGCEVGSAERLPFGIPR